MSETNGTNNYPIVETGRLKAMFYEPKRSYACFKPRRFQRKESLASRSSVSYRKCGNPNPESHSARPNTPGLNHQLTDCEAKIRTNQPYFSIGYELEVLKQLVDLGNAGEPRKKANRAFQCIAPLAAILLYCKRGLSVFWGR